jgi:hypothetical protein
MVSAGVLESGQGLGPSVQTPPSAGHQPHLTSPVNGARQGPRRKFSLADLQGLSGAGSPSARSDPATQ